MSKPSTASSKSAQPVVSRPQSTPPETSTASNYTEVNMSTIQQSPTKSTKLPKLVPLVSNEWNELIDKVIGVTMDSNGLIEIEYVMKTGQKATSPSDIIKYKAPLKLIEFYEENLAFPE